MAMSIITMAIAVFAAIAGVWKWVARMKSERRRLADEAKKKLEGAQTPGDFLDSFDSINRV